MKIQIFGRMLLVLSTLAMAQQPSAPPAAHAQQVLWEFDTGG